MSENKIDYQFFPPNTTPILQPLDHSIIASFKRKYEEEWYKWYCKISHLHRTKQGNRKKASIDTINEWIAAALDSITSEQIKKCWAHTLNGEKILQEAREAAAMRMEAERPRGGVAAAAAATSEVVQQPSICETGQYDDDGVSRVERTVKRRLDVGGDDVEDVPRLDCTCIAVDHVTKE